MPLCHNCDFELAENTGFCPMCGVAQQSSAPESAISEQVSSEESDAVMAKMFGDEPEVIEEQIQQSIIPEEQVNEFERTEQIPYQETAENVEIPKTAESLTFEDEPQPLIEEMAPAVEETEPEVKEIEPLAEEWTEPENSDLVSQPVREEFEPEPEEREMEPVAEEQFDQVPVPDDFSSEELPETALDSEPEALPFEPIREEAAEPIQAADDQTVASDSPEIASEPHILQDDQPQKISTNDIADPNPGVVLNFPADSGQTAHPIGSTGGEGKRAGLKTLPEGTLLNSRYQIVRKIGGGGMGAVYLACDQNLGGVERAVKEMVQSSIEEEQQNKAVDDFKRESTILSTLDHPSIPTIYDYFFDHMEGRFYLVMKYISGGDLAARLRSTPGGRIDEKLVTEWAIQVADVLSYLHNLPTTIVYRDLKPSNIMLDGTTGKIMLIDFGIARSINQEEKGVTAVGTMGYAPPELFSGQVEPRSDIYSLGSTMFHLLTGADPQNNPLLIFDFQKNPRPRQLNTQLSDQMERILMRCVEYNADHRFASADALRRALAEHLDNVRAGQITFGVSEAPAAVSLANQFVFCGFCGQQIVATDLFCAFCGAKQPIAQHGVHADIYPRTGVTAKLVIDGTSELDAPVFSLEKNENLLGRRDPQSNIFPEVDLSKFDPQTKISRRHARIWREGGGFMVEDLGSSNGTMLIAGFSESVRLSPRQPHPLTSGDRLRLGDTTLHFLMS